MDIHSERFLLVFNISGSRVVNRLRNLPIYITPLVTVLPLSTLAAIGSILILYLYSSHISGQRSSRQPWQQITPLSSVSHLRVAASTRLTYYRLGGDVPRTAVHPVRSST